MWRKEFLYYVDVCKEDNFFFIFLGNKIDVNERIVIQEEVYNFCKELGGIFYYEISVKDFINVNIVFIVVVKRLNELE